MPKLRLNHAYILPGPSAYPPIVRTPKNDFAIGRGLELDKQMKPIGDMTYSYAEIDA